MKPLNFKAGVPKLNSELGSSSSARATVISTATQTRSKGSAAHIITVSSTAHTSGNIFFTASSWGHRPRPISGRDMSLAANYRRAAGQRFNAYAQQYWNTGSLSAYNNAQVAYKQSTASSIGEALGALAGLVTTGANAYKTLNEAGLFNKKTQNTGGANPKGAKALEKNLAKVVGNNPKVDPNSISSTGLRSASSFGANFSSDYASLKSAIDSGNFDPQKITADVNKFVISTTEDLYDAKATLSVLQTQKSDATSKLETMQNDVQAAEADMKKAKTDLGTSQSVLNSAKESREAMDNILAKDNAEYKTACDDVIAKENEKDTAQSGVTTCKSALASAETKYTQAQSQTATARNNLNSIPNDAQHALERQAAQRALDLAEKAEAAAKQEKETAQKNLQDAEGKLKEAESNLQKAQTTKSELLTKYENDKTKDQTAVRDCKKAEEGVQRSQKQYDDQLQTTDTCTASYDKAKTTLDSANSVIKQADDLSNRMKELEQNVKNADKLQKSAEKAVEKYNKQHPDAGKSTATPIGEKPAEPKGAEEKTYNGGAIGELKSTSKQGAFAKALQTDDLGKLENMLKGAEDVQDKTQAQQIKDRIEEVTQRNNTLKSLQTRYQQASNVPERSRIEQEARTHGFSIEDLQKTT